MNLPDEKADSEKKTPDGGELPRTAPPEVVDAKDSAEDTTDSSELLSFPIDKLLDLRLVIPVLTAVLSFIGTARTAAKYYYFGLTRSMLDFSTTEYVFQSVEIVALGIPFIFFVGGLCVFIHQSITQIQNDRIRKRLGRVVLLVLRLAVIGILRLAAPLHLESNAILLIIAAFVFYLGYHIHTVEKLSARFSPLLIIGKFLLPGMALLFLLFISFNFIYGEGPPMRNQIMSVWQTRPATSSTASTHWALITPECKKKKCLTTLTHINIVTLGSSS